MFCTCDTSDTEGSEPDSNQAGDPNFYQQQQLQNFGQQNPGYGAIEKPPSLIRTASPRRSLQQTQPSNPERQGSQQGMMSNNNGLPACTCGDRRSSSLLQQQEVRRNSGSKSQQRTSFNLANGPPPIGEPFPGQLTNIQGQQQCQYPQQSAYQQSPLNDQQIQTSGSLIPPGMPNINQGLPTQQNGRSCQAPICRGGQNGVRRASQSSAGSGQMQAPLQNRSGMLNQLQQQQGSQQQVPQVNGSGMLNQQQPIQQLISPCCARGIFNDFNNSMPPNGGAAQDIQQPAFGSPLGGPCFCPTNPGPGDTGAQDNENANNDYCDSCAEFEKGPEDTDNMAANDSAPSCPCDEFENTNEQPYSGSCTCDAAQDSDNEGKANETKSSPQSNCCGMGNGNGDGDGNGDEIGDGTKGEGEDDSGKKNGFYQQLQFQIYQCDGSNNNDGQQVDASRNQQSGDNLAGNTNLNGNENGSVSQNVDGNEGAASSDGKSWQQLTLDIFQSRNGSGGAEGEKSSNGGWQQQLRLMIYQERCENGGPITTTITNGGTNGNGATDSNNGNGGRKNSNGSKGKCAKGDEDCNCPPNFPPSDGMDGYSSLCGCDM